MTATDAYLFLAFLYLASLGPPCRSPSLARAHSTQGVTVVGGEQLLAASAFAFDPKAPSSTLDRSHLASVTLSQLRRGLPTLHLDVSLLSVVHFVDQANCHSGLVVGIIMEPW